MVQIGQLTEGEVEQEIVNKGLTDGPRLTPQDIDAAIKDVHFWKVPNDAMIVCALTLQNDYTVIGHAACLNPSNFDEELGKKLAFNDARDQIWALEGYLMASLRVLRNEDVDNSGGA